MHNFPPNLHCFEEFCGVLLLLSSICNLLIMYKKKNWRKMRKLNKCPWEMNWNYSQKKRKETCWREGRGELNVLIRVRVGWWLLVDFTFHYYWTHHQYIFCFSKKCFVYFIFSSFESCNKTEKVSSPGASRPKHQTLRIAVKKDRLFYDKWGHPEERDANSQKTWTSW